MGVMPDTREDSSSPGAVVRTFLISDIRGYSTFTRERGDETAARLATRFADLAVDAVEARGGTVIGLRGDEALAVFDSTPQAVRAALEFQVACREATDEDPELPLPVGVGIDCGEAIPVEDGYRGKALNMAARLCSKAAAGQVFVTKDVARAVHAGSRTSHSSPVGAVELKGFDQPVELLEAARPSRLESSGPQVAPSRAPLPPELDDFVPLADREYELRWLRGTWRQARRGHGRLVFVSGPAGIGKTRLAAELAAHVLMSGGAVRYSGSGGAGGGETLAAIADARSSDRPNAVRAGRVASVRGSSRGARRVGRGDRVPPGAPARTVPRGRRTPGARRAGRSRGRSRRRPSTARPARSRRRHRHRSVVRRRRRASCRRNRCFARRAACRRACTRS